jgi:hypothetical protein
MHEQTAVIRLPLEGPIFTLVEDWRRSQPKIPSRNEAVRLLLRRALEWPSEKSEAAAADRALEETRAELTKHIAVEPPADGATVLHNRPAPHHPGKSTP